MMKGTLRLSLTLTILLVIGLMDYQCSWAIVTSDTDDSHTVAHGTPVYGVNLNSVGLLGFGKPDSTEFEDVIAVCTGALISGRHVLTAAHCFDQDEDGQIDPLITQFPFVFAFESSDGVEFFDIDQDNIRLPEQWPVQFADIAVVELSEIVPPEMPTYPLYGIGDEVGHRIVLAGYGWPGFGATGQEDNAIRMKRAGLNRVDAIRDDMPGVEFLAFDFDSGLEENNSLAIIGFDSDLGFGPDEVFTGAGDSGGPVFIQGTIAGVTSFTARIPIADVNDEDDSSWGEGGFSTRVSGFRDFIMNATNQAAIFLSIPGDFDGNDLLDTNDVNRLSESIVTENHTSLFDVNEDTLVDQSDLRTWVSSLKHTYFGDANLDGEFNSGDLTTVLAAGEFDDDIDGNSGWATGDWTADGEFTSSDLVVALADGGFGKGERVAPAAVPEPASFAMLLAGLIGIVIRRRRSVR